MKSLKYRLKKHEVTITVSYEFKTDVPALFYENTCIEIALFICHSR